MTQKSFWLFIRKLTHGHKGAEEGIIILKTNKTTSLIAAFSFAASALLISTDCMAGRTAGHPSYKKTKPLIYLEDGQPHMKVKKAGVKIPIRKYEIIDDNKIRIEIDKDSVNPLKYFFAKNAAFSADGFANKKSCPFVDVESKDYNITKEGDIFTVTVTVPEQAIPHIKEKRCVIAPRPSLSEIS